MQFKFFNCISFYHINKFAHYNCLCGQRASTRRKSAKMFTGNRILILFAVLNLFLTSSIIAIPIDTRIRNRLDPTRYQTPIQDTNNATPSPTTHDYAISNDETVFHSKNELITIETAIVEQEDRSCSICYETLEPQDKAPQCFACTHDNFCKSCLLRYKQSNEVICCPLCRSEELQGSVGSYLARFIWVLFGEPVPDFHSWFELN